MGGRARALGLALGFVCAACESFSSVDEPPDDAARESAPTSPRAEDRRASSETTSGGVASGPSNEVSVDDPPAETIFEDDFERPTAELSDGWTGFNGVGLSLDSGMFVAATSASQTSAVLFKDLGGPTKGVRVVARTRAVRDEQFDFADYCNVIDVSLGGYSLATFYVGVGGTWSSWLYAPGGSKGNGREFDFATADMTEVVLDLSWDAAKVSLSSSVNGDVRAHVPVAIGSGLAAAKPMLTIGAECSGDQPKALTASFDSIAIYTK